MEDPARHSFYGVVTVGERGQVVIPQAAREALGIKPGDRMLVVGGPMGNHGLMMLKAEVVSELVARFTERTNSLREMLEMALERQRKDDEPQ
ncbi:MAG: AbrB/MazE/SpoVT family DNA-binding domain-containing protein [Firmicutes bacterium]|nr:AbrB/MazE/SpoVT family DNA-binding domain-containing protein [Bacillota bacterium]